MCPVPERCVSLACVCLSLDAETHASTAQPTAIFLSTQCTGHLRPLDQYVGDCVTQTADRDLEVLRTEVLTTDTFSRRGLISSLYRRGEGGRGALSSLGSGSHP